MSKKKREALNLEDKYDEVRQLVILGKERGFLAIEEVTEMLPDEISNSPDEVEEVFSLLETQGIELVDDETKERLKVMGGQPPVKKKGANKPSMDPLEKTNDPVSMYQSDVLTIPVNIAGIPCISVPCGFSEGLPIGMQVMGKALSEETILNIAYTYQQATDWHTKRPPGLGKA